MSQILLPDDTQELGPLFLEEKKASSEQVQGINDK